MEVSLQGMIRAVALWGAKLGWRGQRARRTGLGGTGESDCRVESPMTVLDAAQARLTGKLMRDPKALRDL